MIIVIIIILPRVSVTPTLVLRIGKKVVRSDVGKTHTFKAKPQISLQNWKQAAAASRKDAVQDLWCQY